MLRNIFYLIILLLACSCMSNKYSTGDMPMCAMPFSKKILKITPTYKSIEMIAVDGSLIMKETKRAINDIFPLTQIIAFKDSTAAEWTVVDMGDYWESYGKVDTIVDTISIYRFYREMFYNCLDKDSIADFFYDECLDYNNVTTPDYEHGCMLNSIRYFIVRNLSSNDIEKILSIADVERLDKICTKVDNIKITNSEFSTLKLLEKKLGVQIRLRH